MSASYSPVLFNDLPETDYLLSSDKIILFNEDSSGDLHPSLSTLIDLSSYIVLPSEIDEIIDRVSKIKDLLNNTILNLQKNFISKADAAKLYGTKAGLNEIANKFETVEEFNSLLADKAEIEYLEYYANKILANCSNMKYMLGSEWHSDYIGYKPLLVAKAGVGVGE